MRLFFAGLLFWQYARQTPFLHDIIQQNLIYLEPHFLPFYKYTYYLGNAQLKKGFILIKEKVKNFLRAIHQNALYQAGKNR